MSIMIRPMEERDIAALAAIDAVCESHPFTEAQFLEELEAPHARVLVAVEADEPLGFIDFHIAADDLHINEFGVRPDARRRGIGRALMDAALAAGREAGCVLASLEARVSNEPACALYEKAGFKSAGLRRRFYRDPQEDAVIYLLSLSE